MPLPRMLLLLASALLSGICAFGLPTDDDLLHDLTGSSYRDFVVNGNRIYALTDSGQIVVWDAERADTAGIIRLPNSRRFYSISVDRNDNLYAGGWDTSAVFRINKHTLRCQRVIASPYYPVTHIVFNSANRMWIIVPDALCDPFSGRYWMNFWNDPEHLSFRISKRFGWFFKRRTDYFFRVPDFTIVDRNDLLIMAEDYGEWGSQFYYFDTRREQPLKPSDTVAGLCAMNVEGLFLNGMGEAFVSQSRQFDRDTARRSGISKIIDHQRLISYPSPYRDQNYFNQVDAEGERRIYLNNPYMVSWSDATLNKEDGCVYSLSATGGPGANIMRSRVFGDTAVTKREQILEVFRAVRWRNNKLFASARYVVWITVSDGLGVYDVRRKEVSYLK